jgi:hypothetical protein
MARCVDCGFLCRYEREQGYVEFSYDMRKEFMDGANLRLKDPRCFVLAFDLPSECESSTDPVSRIGHVIAKERPCDSCVPYRPGYPPKDHEAMLNMQEQRKWEQDQRDRDRDWQEKRRTEDLRWQVEQARLAEERWAKDHKMQWRTFVWVGLFGMIILAIAQIVGALVQAGILFPQGK